MLELLSPAGSRECLVAAVQNGADAVYFGGSMLNARRFAGNFAGDSLVEALDYCHERNVRAYITLNTLVFDRELPAALEFAEQLYRFGADAVLVQDLGLAALVRHNLPDLTVHASTQMGIHDIGGLRYCEMHGIKRAVLAREVSLKEIALLSKQSSVELEAFGHGALCMSFSGSCLYSSMAGERSGNRGTCAQPCRKNASVNGWPNSTDFCLSPNDICMIEHLAELENAGVCCIKIEGRMKKTEYVAAVTRCYRSALDGASTAEIGEMKKVLYRLFNRGEFSTSHMFYDSVKTDRVGSSKPSREDTAAANQSVLGENRKTAVEMYLKLEVGKTARLSISAAGKAFQAIGETVQPASKEQHESTYAERHAKLGDTPFALGNCSVDMAPDCYLSASSLNSLRRAACAGLSAEFHVRNEVQKPSEPYRKHSAAPEKTADIPKKPFVYAAVGDAKAALDAFEAGADIVSIEHTEYDCAIAEKLKDYRINGKKLLLALPNVIINSDQRAFIIRQLDSGIFDGAEANNIGQLELIGDLELKIAGIGLNALNTFTINELLENGFDYVIPSPELTSVQLESICEEYAPRLILPIHGRVPVMQLLHCPVKEHGGCKSCKGDAGCITDDAGRRFPLANFRFPDRCLVRMLNCSTTDLIDLYEKLPNVAGLRLGFIGEETNSIAERMESLLNAMRGETVPQYPNSTRGHWNRKVD